MEIEIERSDFLLKLQQMKIDCIKEEVKKFLEKNPEVKEENLYITENQYGMITVYPEKPHWITVKEALDKKINEIIDTNLAKFYEY
jgi:hypothetical protein